MHVQRLIAILSLVLMTALAWGVDHQSELDRIGQAIAAAASEGRAVEEDPAMVVTVDDMKAFMAGLGELIPERERTMSDEKLADQAEYFTSSFETGFAVGRLQLSEKLGTEEGENPFAGCRYLGATYAMIPERSNEQGLGMLSYTMVFSVPGNHVVVMGGSAMSAPDRLFVQSIKTTGWAVH